MAKIHLLVGPVGAGKSTFASQLCREHAAVHLNLDAWMVDLFSKDRPEVGVMPWYVERARRCIEQIWKIAQAMVLVDTNVVLEIGLLQRVEREEMYARIEAQDIPFTTYVLDAPREVRRQRVVKRNLEKGATFSMIVPPEIFELASDMWEPLEDAECIERDIQHITVG